MTTKSYLIAAGLDPDEWVVLSDGDHFLAIEENKPKGCVREFLVLNKQELAKKNWVWEQIKKRIAG